MLHSQTEKSCLYDTNLTYDPTSKDPLPMTSSRTYTNLDKQNVVPCAGQIQGFISTLSQKKHHLKGLLIEKQQLNDISVQQGTKLSNESIRQTYEMERQLQLHNQNERTLEEVQQMKKQKLKNMEKMLNLKKSLETRFEQIMQMKKLLSELQEQGKSIESQITIMSRQNQVLADQNTDLDLMCQGLENDVMHMKQTVRQSQVRRTTAQSALNMFKSRIQSTLNDLKTQNKQTRKLTQTINQTGDKIRKLREQRAEYDINSNQIMIRNQNINDTNIKLRNDLERCKMHLQCVIKNNELLGNSIEEFTYVDERVTKIIKRNDLKNL